VSLARRAWQRLWQAIRPSAAAPGLEREIDSHLALLADEFARRGLSPEEARLAARRRFGSVAHAKDLHRDSRSFVWLEDIRRDVIVAVRMLRRTPGFASVAVLTLAIGIGVNTIVFTITNAVLFKGFPLVERNDRLLYLTSGKGCCLSYPDFEDWQQQATSFAGMALVHGMSATVSEGSRGPELFTATAVTANTFQLVGQQPTLGRDFTAADERPGAPLVILLRHGLWQRRFGSDPRILGKTLLVNGRPGTVVGVMPRGFSFPQNQDLWIPLARPADARRDVRDNWFALGRLADGVDIEQARTEMGVIGRRLGEAYPATNQGRNLVPFVSTFEEFFVGSSAGAMYRAMWGAVGFVMLIACANLANLLMARALTRAEEISVRMAIGAGRWRVMRQLLVESVLLSAMGGFAGWWLARWGVAAYATATNGWGVSEQNFGVWFMNVLDYSMDYQAFAYLAAISLGTGLLFDVLPALRLSATDAGGRLGHSRRGLTADPRSRRASWLLVAAEMTLAIVLTAGAGMLLRSFLAVYTADPGFDALEVTTAQVVLPRARYATPERQRDLFERLTTQVQNTAGVDTVAAASALPGWTLAPRAFEIDGVPVPDTRDRPAAGTVTVSSEYFRALGVRMGRGRAFLATDDSDRGPVVIVNEQFARRYLPDGALDRRIRFYADSVPDVWMTVVGIAPNIVQNRDLRQQDALLYVPARQRPAAGMWLLVRSQVESEALMDSLRTTLAALDPELPLADGPMALTDRLARNYQYRAVMASVFGLFAAIALLLAALGLYAVMAHAVSVRRREIGIRTAMGATVIDILTLVVAQGMKPIAVGILGGVITAVLLGRLLQAEFAQVTPSDPAMLAAASAILLAVSLAGCLVPARRALRVDPVTALRQADERRSRA
jgi:putative ABC transport system permease protein